VIDQIAFQTKLLALDAAIEEAQAGQHCKGFAVGCRRGQLVACRAKEGQETADLIADSVQKTERRGEIASIRQKLPNRSMNGSKVSDLPEDIASASHEQAEGTAQLNQDLGLIDQVI